jgi:hypothetical protein
MSSIAGTTVYKALSLYNNFLENHTIKFAGTEERQKDVAVPKAIEEAWNGQIRKTFRENFDIVPFGGAGDAYGEFTRRSLAALIKGLKSVFAEKLKKDPDNFIFIKPEVYKDLIGDFALFIRGYSSTSMDDAILKAYMSKDQLARIDGRTGKPVEESVEESNDRRSNPENLGLAQSFFVPKADEITLKKLEEGGEDISDMEVGSVDTYVINVLKDHVEKNIKWVYKGFDENRIKFTLPDLFGSRVFVITSPLDVKHIRDPKARKDIQESFKSGSYTFKVIRVGKNGAVLQFIEQADLIKKRKIPEIKSKGLSKNELFKLFDILAQAFVSKFRSMSLENLNEKFNGAENIHLRPGTVSEARNFAELIQMGDKGKSEKSFEKSKGVEETLQKYQESKTKADKKEQERQDAQSEYIGLMELLSGHGSPRDYDEVIEGILQKLPKKIVPNPKGTKYGLGSLLNTKQVSSHILKIMFSEHTPIGKGKDQPWKRLVANWLWEKAHLEPDVRELVSDLVYLQDYEKNKKTNKKEVSPSPENSAQEEKNLKNLVTNKLAVSLDFSGINKLLKDRSVGGPASTPPTAPTKSTPNLKPEMKGEIPGKKKTIKEVSDEYKQSLVPSTFEDKLNPNLNNRVELSPPEVQKFLRSFSEDTVKDLLTRYTENLNDIIKNRLSDIPLVEKAKERRKNFINYLKKDLSRHIADYLNQDLSEYERIHSEIEKLNREKLELNRIKTNLNSNNRLSPNDKKLRINKVDVKIKEITEKIKPLQTKIVNNPGEKGLTDAKAEEWDNNQEKAIEIVKDYLENPKKVDTKMRGIIVRYINKRTTQSQRNASEQFNIHKAVISLAFKKLKMIEKGL